MRITAAILVRPLALLVLVLLGTATSSAAQGAAISAIVGPVIPLGQSPWPWYDKAFQGNANEVMAAALAHPPIPGSPAPGTFTLSFSCPNTLTGAGASDFAVPSTAVIYWNTVNGPKTGRHLFRITRRQGDVLTSDVDCSHLPAMISGGLTNLKVHHCDIGCDRDRPDGTYSSSWWGLGGGGDGWNYYDVGLAIYRLYLRTGDSTYLTQFRAFEDLWWTWGLNSGARIVSPPRQFSLVGAYVAALDGHPERLPLLHAMVKANIDFNIFATVNPDDPKTYFDNREMGYVTMFLAVGARADADPSRHSWYCTTLASKVDNWIDTQRPEGYWSEKNAQYAYRPPGVSPWRMYASVQGLARAYDVLNDTTSAGCNHPTLAAQLLPVVTKAVDFTYLYGRADNRGVYYDVQYPNAGQEGTNAGLKPGTVSIAPGSSTVTGTGTAFQTTFACNGTDWIGIAHSDGFGWTYKVQSCGGNNHLTIAGTWGEQGEATSAIGAGYYQTASAPTNCGSSLASTCWSGLSGNPLPGDRNNARQLIWAHGWLFNKTGNPIYKTRGDELFSASYGGPAGGPGFNYPNHPGPCGGPACDGVETDYFVALHACAVNPTLPCNAGTNYPVGNVYVFTGKRFGQGSGIGGADNYLAWRIGATSPPPPPSRRNPK